LVTKTCVLIAADKVYRENNVDDQDAGFRDCVYMGMKNMSDVN